MTSDMNAKSIEVKQHTWNILNSVSFSVLYVISLFILKIREPVNSRKSYESFSLFEIIENSTGSITNCPIQKGEFVPIIQKEFFI